MFFKKLLHAHSTLQMKDHGYFLYYTYRQSGKLISTFSFKVVFVVFSAHFNLSTQKNFMVEISIYNGEYSLTAIP